MAWLVERTPAGQLLAAKFKWIYVSAGNLTANPLTVLRNGFGPRVIVVDGKRVTPFRGPRDYDRPGWLPISSLAAQPNAKGMGLIWHGLAHLQSWWSDDVQTFSRRIGNNTKPA